MDPKTLCYVELYKNGNNPVSLFVRDEDGESFSIVGPAHILTLHDEDLKPDEKTGKVIISLEPLMEDMKNICGNLEPPKIFDFPVKILEERREKRRIKALEKDAVFIDRSGPEPMYFYLEGEELRIRKGEKEIIAEEILEIQGHKTVSARDLDLGFLCLILPGEVLKKWEPVLEAKRLKKLALIPASDSLTDLKKYYKLNINIPQRLWLKVSNLFINWGDPDGWVTSEPSRVSEILHIPIE